jgi:hypothetical protein
MGRRKITIKPIADPKLRHITFNKRKNGLIKKAAELSLLCNINMLLIFEDGNGNLVQFSKNKLANIHSFFQECRYNNLLEFSAKDYPNFFKVNHYKKSRDREFDDGSQDETVEIRGDGKLLSKRDRLQSNGHIKEEDRDSSKMIYQSGSEDSDDEDEEMALYEPPTKETYQSQQKKKNPMNVKTKMLKTDEKQKLIGAEEDISASMNIAPDTTSNQKEIFQNFKENPQRIARGEKPMNYEQQFMGFENPFKGNNPGGDQPNPSFRFYPTNNPGINVPSNPTNAYPNNPNYTNGHPYIHNNHGYPGVPNNFQVNNKNNRIRNFPMGNMSNEETLNAMFKGLPLGFAMGAPTSFITKPNARPDMDEKMLDTANMIKYLNGAGANTFNGQKMYNFHPNETGKSEDVDPMSQMRNRNEGETVPYDHEHDFHEAPPPQYVRGDFRIDGSLPSNLPSAYFSSKKFNFDGYFNNFEDDRYNEYADSKKKIKQGQQ